MKKTLLVLAVFLLCLTAFGKSFVPDYAKDEIMTSDKLTRGMEGYGLTVFQGVTIEKFNFKILGIMKGFNRGRDVIYVELDHPRINRSNSGVMHGMSGSPCYVNGKLIGAVSLGYSYAKENVCMLTPIEDMFEAWDTNLDRPELLSSPNPVSESPIPLSVSGLTSKTQSLMSSSLKEMGFLLTAGTGYGSKENMPDADKATLEPGASVGVTIIDGDIVATATGTVTYKKGNKILAFGHPMEEIGVCELPMSKAYVVDIFSSVEASSKMYNPLEIVGTVYQDRSFSIAGEIGKEAKMYPVNVHIKDLSTKREQNLKCRVAAQSVYFNAFAPAVILEGLNRCRVEQAPTYGEFTYNIELENGKTYTFTNCYTGQTSVADSVFEELGNILTQLNGTTFGIQKIKGISVNGEVCDGNRSSFIERVFLNKNTFRPGDDIKIGIEMRKYGSEKTYTEYKTITVPKNAEPGKFALLVYGGSFAENIDLNKDDEKENNAGIYADNSVSFDRYFQNYLKFDKNNELIINLIPENGSTIVAKGEELQDLPDYMKILFDNANNSVITNKAVEYKSVFPSEDIPLGAAVIGFPVENEQKSANLDNNAKPMAVFSKVLPINAKTDLKSNDLKEKIVRMIDELDQAIRVTSEDVKANNISSELQEMTEEEKEAEAKEEKEEKKEEKKKDIKSSIKKPLVYELKEAKDLNQGIYKNCNYGSCGILPTVEYAKTISATPQLATCAEKTKYGLLAGFGLDCGVAFLRGDVLSEITPLEGMWVSAICETEKGIYVATNPGGNIYKVTDGDRPVCEKLSFNCHHKYISAMFPTEDKIIMGFSDSDELLLLDENMKIIKKAEHGCGFTTDFTFHDGTVIIGTKDSIVCIDEEFKPWPYMNGLGGTVSAITANSDGDIYAYITGKNTIIKITDQGITKLVQKAGEMFDAYTDDTDTVYFVGKDTITKIYDDDRYVSDKQTDTAAQFSHITPADDGEAIITSANPGNIFRIKLHPDEAVYTSPFIHMGTEIVLKEINAPIIGKNIFVGTALEDAVPAENVYGAGRFRIIVKFLEDTAGDFNKISVKYFMPNRTPEVKITSPDVYDTIKGKKKIEWTVSDPDNDTYLVNIELFNYDTEETYTIYPNDKDQYEPDKDPIKSYEFDTTEFPDGLYALTVSADDSPTNGENGLTGTDSLELIEIKNQVPEIIIEKHEIDEDGTVTVYGKVSGNNILGAEISTGGTFISIPIEDDGTWSVSISTEKDVLEMVFRVIDDYENYSETKYSVDMKTGKTSENITEENREDNKDDEANSSDEAVEDGEKE